MRRKATRGGGRGRKATTRSAAAADDDSQVLSDTSVTTPVDDDAGDAASQDAEQEVEATMTEETATVDTSAAEEHDGAEVQKVAVEPENAPIEQAQEAVPELFEEKAGDAEVVEAAKQEPEKPVEQKQEQPAKQKQDKPAAAENGDGNTNVATTEASTLASAKKNAPAEAEVEDSEFAENEVYKSLRAQFVKPTVAVALIQLYESTDVVPEDLDERAIEMLCKLPEEHALFIVKEVKESRLMGVQNKAQFLMSVMRNFCEKVRQVGASVALTQKLVNGPSVDKIKEIVDRTGYPLEVTIGQRKYGGPPPGWEGPAAGPGGSGHEIYIGKIPKEVYEDALILLFEEVGKIWDLRLMMDPLTGKNRGYAFLTFCDKTSAAEAAKKYDGHEILPGKNLKVNVSVANTRLFVGSIPKSKSKEEIIAEFKEHTEGVVDCIIYSSPDSGDSRKNRGFCFLDFYDHKTASDAKRKIHAGKLRPWNTDLVVDWAEQQDEPDDDTMAKVKVLYVRNLKEAVTEEQLKEMFSAYGEVDRAKKIRDYAFIHFMERDPAVKAMEALNGTMLEGIPVDISLAKPQSEKRKMMRGRGRGFGGPRGDFGAFREGGFRGRGSPGFARGGGGGGYGSPDFGYGGGGYDDMYGYGAGPAAFSYGYDAYGYMMDPYAYPYGGPMGPRGGARGMGSGFAQRGSGGRGRAPRGGRGGGPRGMKRSADGDMGHLNKRQYVGDDFTADVHTTSF